MPVTHKVPSLGKPGSVRGIHLDFKYHMPNKRYMLDWLKRLPGYGINAILVEYEDKFPFKKYPFLRDKDAFTPAELREFLATAHKAGLTVIPLVQSLSHFEWALDHPKLAHLREMPDIPTQFCPLNPDAIRFVTDLYKEVLAYHKDDPYFHMGGDETWFVGSCPKCKARLEAFGGNVIDFWAEHQKGLLPTIIEAGKRPILWDDTFWKDFDAIQRVGLPKEVILHAWNYNISSLTPKNSDSTDSEFGGAAGVLRQIATYRKAGYDSVAGPCYNFGQLFTRHEFSIKNTWVWCKKIRQEKMLGMLNTQWAVFHLPFQVLNLQVAATGRMCANPDADMSPKWQKAWLKKEFGAAPEGVTEALETLGAHFEIPMPDYGRSFTAIVYCYMNMVLHYPGRQPERRKRGAYPVNWEEIDFSKMYRKGVAEARKGDLAVTLARFDAVTARYPQAVAAMKQLAAEATAHKDEAEMMAVFAELKHASAKVLSHMLRGDGDVKALRAELLALKEPVRAQLHAAWEPVGAERMFRALWEPQYKAVGGR